MVVSLLMILLSCSALSANNEMQQFSCDGQPQKCPKFVDFKTLGCIGSNTIYRYFVTLYKRVMNETSQDHLFQWKRRALFYSSEGSMELPCLLPDGITLLQVDDDDSCGSWNSHGIVECEPDVTVSSNRSTETSQSGIQAPIERRLLSCDETPPICPEFMDFSTLGCIGNDTILYYIFNVYKKMANTTSQGRQFQWEKRQIFYALDEWMDLPCLLPDGVTLLRQNKEDYTCTSWRMYGTEKCKPDGTKPYHRSTHPSETSSIQSIGQSTNLTQQYEGQSILCYEKPEPCIASIEYSTSKCTVDETVYAYIVKQYKPSSGDTSLGDGYDSYKHVVFYTFEGWMEFPCFLPDNSTLLLPNGASNCNLIKAYGFEKCLVTSNMRAPQADDQAAPIERRGSAIEKTDDSSILETFVYSWLQFLFVCAVILLIFFITWRHQAIMKRMQLQLFLLTPQPPIPVNPRVEEEFVLRNVQRHDHITGYVA